MKVRNATIYDSGAVAALHREIITQVYGNTYASAAVGAWSGSHTVASWIARIEGGSVFLLAESDDEIIGCGGLTLNRTGIYIHPSVQRQGVAAMLLNELEKIALTRGIYTLELSAPEKAVAFYRAAGFAVVERNITLFSNGSELETYDMQKMLNHVGGGAYANAERSQAMRI